MTMNDIPQAPTTWCDPDDVGAPLPETDEVEADPQTVQIPPAESFEVLRRASEVSSSIRWSPDEPRSPLP